MKEQGQMYKRLPKNFQFVPQDLVIIFQSLVMILLRFSTTITKSLGKNKKIWGKKHAEQVCQVSWR